MSETITVTFWENDYELTAWCDKCGVTVEVYGTTDASKRAAFAKLREECQHKAYYVEDTGTASPATAKFRPPILRREYNAWDQNTQWAFKQVLADLYEIEVDDLDRYGYLEEMFAGNLYL